MKTLWEKEKLLEQPISPFPTVFSILSKTEIIIFVTFVICKCFQFGLVQNFVLWEWVNPISDNRILDWSIFKQIADEIFKVHLTLSQTSPGFTCLQYKRDKQILLFP